MPIRDHATLADPAKPGFGAKGRYILNGEPIVAPALAGGLHVVATPIGNLRDVTLRALEVLAAADLIACEDTRVTRKLIDHYGITTPLTPYHDHNAAAARPKRRARIAELARVPATLVLFESGPRLAAALADLAIGLGPRAAAICRELTKL